MVEIELDGQKVEVPPGSMVMHAAENKTTPELCATTENVSELLRNGARTTALRPTA